MVNFRGHGEIPEYKNYENQVSRTLKKGTEGQSGAALCGLIFKNLASMAVTKFYRIAYFFNNNDWVDNKKIRDILKNDIQIFTDEIEKEPLTKDEALKIEPRIKEMRQVCNLLNEGRISTKQHEEVKTMDKDLSQIETIIKEKKKWEAKPRTVEGKKYLAPQRDRLESGQGKITKETKRQLLRKHAVKSPIASKPESKEIKEEAETQGKEDVSEKLAKGNLDFVTKGSEYLLTKEAAKKPKVPAGLRPGEPRGAQYIHKDMPRSKRALEPGLKAREHLDLHVGELKSKRLQDFKEIEITDTQILNKTDSRRFKKLLKESLGALVDHAADKKYIPSELGMYAKEIANLKETSPQKAFNNVSHVLELLENELKKNKILNSSFTEDLRSEFSRGDKKLKELYNHVLEYREKLIKTLSSSVSSEPEERRPVTESSKAPSPQIVEHKLPPKAGAKTEFTTEHERKRIEGRGEGIKRTRSLKEVEVSDPLLLAQGKEERKNYLKAELKNSISAFVNYARKNLDEMPDINDLTSKYDTLSLEEAHVNADEVFDIIDKRFKEKYGKSTPIEYDDVHDNAVDAYNNVYFYFNPSEKE